MDRERQIAYDLTNMWNLKNKTNKIKQNENRLIETQNKGVVARGKGDQGWGLYESVFWKQVVLFQCEYLGVWDYVYADSVKPYVYFWL